MPRRRRLAGAALPEITQDVPFPLEGIDVTRALMRQRTLTTPSALNVRGFEPGSDRARGGQRHGLSKYLSQQISGSSPIQGITRLVGQLPVAMPATTGQALRSLGLSNGVGETSGTTGASLWTGLATAGFQFACSCCDGAGNVYIAEVNPTTGATKIFANPAGTATSTWSQTTITCATGSIRNLAGLVVIDDLLYVAITKVVGSSYAIYRIVTATGVFHEGSNAAPWKTQATIAGLAYSTAAINVFGSIGTLLGIECKGTGFLIYDTVGNVFVTVTYATGGAAANQRSRVSSDNIGTFYVLTSTTTNLVQAISATGFVVWTSTVCDAFGPQGLVYDTSTKQLVVCQRGAPSAVILAIADGTLANSGNPGDSPSWSWVDSDQAGHFTFWRDSVATGDLCGTDQALSAVWGPLTFANTTHSGASVNFVPSTVAATRREVLDFAVANGDIRIFDASSVTTVTGGNGALNNQAPVVFAAQCGTGLFFVDGSVYRYYDALLNSVQAWAAAPGDLPTDNANNPAALIAIWNGRIVLSGLPNEGQNWFMSAQLQPFNFDYAPPIASITQAVDGNNAPSGTVGDIITCLLPYTDSIFVFGCSHSIWQLTGDPMNGGVLTNISQSIGMAWGRPYTIDPYGQVFFMGSDGRIYKMVPGALPVQMSQAINEYLTALNISANTSVVRLVWDMRNQGLWVFITPVVAGAATHFFWEERTNAWWPQQFANTSHDPATVWVENADAAAAQVYMLGGRDGYIRKLDEAAVDDDGTAIASSVVLGPVGTKELDEILLKHFLATLALDAGVVSYSVYVGQTAEDALASDPVATGTWGPGRNTVAHIRRSGVQVYLQISASNGWALERIMALYSPRGRIRERGYYPASAVQPAGPEPIGALVEVNQSNQNADSN